MLKPKRFKSTLLKATGVFDDTVRNILFNPTSGIFSTGSTYQMLRHGVSDSIQIRFVPNDTGIVMSTMSIMTGLCEKKYDVSLVGRGIQGSAEATQGALPSGNALFQNRPNPFSDNTTIEFDLAERTNARLVISDVLGRVCAVICDEKMSAGHHVKDFAQSSLPAGTYVCTLQTSGGVIRRVMVKE